MKKILLLLPFFLLFSCSVQKRKYQKGFYVSNYKNASLHKINKVKIKEDNTPEKLTSKDVILEDSERTTNYEASASDIPGIILPSKLPGLYTDPKDSCDVITLKNGDEVKAHVLEITPIDIKYKKCDLPDGPLYIVKKQDVFMIKYSNGTKEIIKEEASNPNLSNNQKTNPNNNNNYQDQQRMHPLAIIALVACILGIFTYGIGFLLGYIFSKIAMKKITEQPQRYRGLILAKVVSIICLVIISIVTFILLLGFLLTV